MSGVGAILGTVGRIASNVSSLTRIAPEPRSRNGDSFASIARNIAQGLSNNSVYGQIDPVFGDLIQRQIESQTQMQLVSLESNILKSEHETQMAAIRNVRVA